MAYVSATFPEGFRNVDTLMSPEEMRGTHLATPHNIWPLQRCQLTKTDHTLIIPCDLHNHASVTTFLDTFKVDDLK